MAQMCVVFLDSHVGMSRSPGLYTGSSALLLLEFGHLLDPGDGLENSFGHGAPARFVSAT